MLILRKIDNEQYTNLKREISILYEEMSKKRIDSLLNNITITDYDKEKQLDKIEDDISDAYSKGKINEQHYNLTRN